MLDSNIPAARGSPQWEFVRRELELQRRPCTLAVWHHPLFTSGQNGPNLHRLQLVGWTVIYLGVFITDTCAKLTFPELDDKTLILLGLSATTYVWFRRGEK